MKNRKGYVRVVFVLLAAMLGVTGGLTLLAARAGPFGAPAIIRSSPGPGSLVVWDATGLQPAESGAFVSLAQGGVQTLALRTNGKLYLSPSANGLPQPIGLEDQVFKAVGMGRNHGLAIYPNGHIATWGLAVARCIELPTPTTPDTPCLAPPGDFVAVTGGGQFSVALDKNDNVVLKRL